MVKLEVLTVGDDGIKERLSRVASTSPELWQRGVGDEDVEKLSAEAVLAQVVTD